MSTVLDHVQDTLEQDTREQEIDAAFGDLMFEEDINPINDFDNSGLLLDWPDDVIQLAPPPEAAYSSLEQGERAFDEWCMKRGYALRQCNRKVKIKDGVKTVTHRYYECDRAKPRSNYEAKQRRKGSLSTDCKFRCGLALQEGIWVSKTTVTEHNHEPAPAEQHPGLRRRLRRRQLQYEIQQAFYSGESIKTCLVRLQQKLDIPLLRQDIVNERRRLKLEDLHGRSPLQALLYRMPDNYIIWIDQDESHHLQQMLFFHKTALDLWLHNPDVVLMDTTYNTNRFNLPLVNLVGVTASNKSFFIGAAFVPSESTEAFRWILIRLQLIYNKADLPGPRVFITDAARQMNNALKDIFPGIPHLICIWHVNRAIQAWVKGYYRSQLPLYNRTGEDRRHWINERYQEFLQWWQPVIYAKTEYEYEEAWRVLKLHYIIDDNLVNYLKITWIRPHACQFVYYYTSQVLHFGNVATSRLEGMHQVLKGQLASKQSSIDTIIDRFSLLQQSMNATIKYNLGRDRHARRPGYDHPFWSRVVGHVSYYALEKVRQALIACNVKVDSPYPLPGPPNGWKACSRQLTTAWGLPCPHIIWRRLQERGHLTINDFERHWRFNRDISPTFSFIDIIQNPQTIPRQRQQRPPLLTGRVLSAFEQEERDVNSIDRNLTIRRRSRSPERQQGQERGHKTRDRT
jgi:hypothetical protein